MSSTSRRSFAATVVSSLALLTIPSAAGAADQIAYSCKDFDDICLVDPDAGTSSNITSTGAALERNPSWSPDGTKLAYSGLLAGQGAWDVFTIDLASPSTFTNVSQTPNHSEAFRPIVWSPSGQRIAFESTPNSSADPLSAEILAGSPDGTLTPFALGSSAAYESQPTYSPDGTKIAFVRGTSTYTASAAGNDAGAFLGGGTQPDWSPDGELIAMKANSAIRIVRADGTGTPVDLPIQSGVTAAGPYFSPDSQRVMWNLQNKIYIRNADGTGTTTEFTTVNGNVTGNSMDWSPDGSRIAFSGDGEDPGVQALWVANSDGTGQRIVSSTLDASSIDPVWKPSATSPPVDPPVDPPPPPGTQTRPPVTFSLLAFSKAVTVENGFIPIGGVSCPNNPIYASNPRCAWLLEGLASGGQFNTPGGKRAAVLAKKRKKLKLPGVALELAPGESGVLKLKVSKRAKKLLKPGAKYKLKVSVDQSVGADPLVETTETLKLKVPKKGK